MLDQEIPEQITRASTNGIAERFDIQDALYEFPYHYLPTISDNGSFNLQRSLTWGLEYLTYMTHVADLVRQRQPSSLLDVGCGDGRLLHMVKSSVPRITGIDLSERAISFARAFNPDVEILCGDIAGLSQQYDIVTLVEVLEHIPDQKIDEFVHNVAQLLSPTGRLVVTVPTTNVPINRKHYRHYNLSTLTETLMADFHIEGIWWLYRRCTTERLIRKSILNNFYILNYSPMLALIWRIHKKLTYHAHSTNGAHLVCLARLQ